ncbi:MAG: FKBP-type peptidyl-prolyl cis-trans isomerase [Chitinophagaceae bacterium]|jgi:FKBP-type peptidyl-prolyl cis-trans isomerase FkpA|uniref:FKBP-type peptidyl-prolyl cis-trans isomerase n=1 Tax=unclassified Paraflavitalea TaxID=2798305 RepID=UPI003D332CFE|nr:FKBP-type peptidyl-prolyl cis-trans isomerase [Chitinophagaceae bacterium]
MKRLSLMALAALFVLGFAACNGGGSFKRTKSGLMYKIISDQKNPLPKNGQFLKFEYVQKVRDSILFSSAENGPAYVVIDSAATPDYNPNEIFAFLRKGDSAVVIIEADTIRKKNGGQLPAFLKSKDKVYLTIKVIDLFATQDLADADRKATMEVYMKKAEQEAEKQKLKDLETLNAYVKSKNITVQSAPQGTLVEITNPGTGAQVDSGKYVSVMYTGQTMAGKVFDSSIDPKFQHPGQPYTFMIGGRGAIKGWDDGLRLFKKGGKGRLYIPSAYAYGKQGAGEDIKPNENLIFDVEVVEVSDTMPKSAQQMPGGH